MAYDRPNTGNDPRDERSRWSENQSDRSDRYQSRDRGDNDQRGFFERAGDEIASWFGDDDSDHRHGDERMRHDRQRSDFGRDRNPNDNRGTFSRGGSSDSDYNRNWRGEYARDYRPMTGDYGRHEHESSQFFAASGVGRNERDRDRERGSQSPWGRDEYRRTSYAGSTRGRSDDRDHDPHYRSWRQQHMDSLDRDYDEYRREHQSKFEDDFGSWRDKRQQKRGMLGQIREHMDVVGNDDEHVGTVDKVAGDRIVLTRSDPESGGSHHSLSCSDIDRVEGDRVILDCSAAEAKKKWRDEDRSRALFERHDQGEEGPHMLNRSFEGTYR